MNLRSISLALTAFLLTACGGSDDDSVVTRDISLNVSAVVGGNFSGVWRINRRTGGYWQRR